MESAIQIQIQIGEYEGISPLTTKLCLDNSQDWEAISGDRVYVGSAVVILHPFPPFPSYPLPGGDGLVEKAFLSMLLFGWQFWLVIGSGFRVRCGSWSGHDRATEIRGVNSRPARPAIGVGYVHILWLRLHFQDTLALFEFTPGTCHLSERRWCRISASARFHQQVLEFNSLIIRGARWLALGLCLWVAVRRG